MGASAGNHLKRTKNFASIAHSSLSNSKTLSSYGYNSSSPMERLMGQQVGKKGRVRQMKM